MGKSIVLVVALVAANLGFVRLAWNRYGEFVAAGTDARFRGKIAEMRVQDKKELDDALRHLAQPHAPSLPPSDPSREITPYEKFLLGANEAQSPTSGMELDRFWLMWYAENDLEDARAIRASLGGWDSRLQKAKSIYPGRLPKERQEYITEHIHESNCVASMPGLMEARQQFVGAFYLYWAHTLTHPPQGGVAKAALELKRAAAEYERAITEAVKKSDCYVPSSTERLLALSRGYRKPFFDPRQELQVVRDVLSVAERCGDTFDRLGPTARARAGESSAGKTFPVMLLQWRKFDRFTDEVCRGE
jgi:hypothetical protein